MEKDKRFSYISSFDRERIKKNVTSANEQLRKLQDLITSHGETLKDATLYQELGADYKCRAEVQRMKDWLEKTDTPEYLHQDYIERAYNACGSDTLAYYLLIRRRLEIRVGIMSSDPVLNLGTDVEEINGKWQIKDDFVNALLESERVYLDAEQIKDLEEFKKMRKVMDAFAQRHYNPSRTYDNTKNIQDDATLMEVLMRNKGYDTGNKSVPAFSIMGV